MASTPRSGYITTPREYSSPRVSPRVIAPAARPHMQHHHGYGWGDSPNHAAPFGSIPLRGTEVFREQRTSLDLHGDYNQHDQGLQMSPHPFLKPSQRLHGNVLDAGGSVEDRLPPRASRKPKLEHHNVKPHQAHFLSWPGHSLYVPKKKHYFRASVDSRHEARGELPPTAQMLISAGSRPGFPTFSITASKGK